MWTLLLACRVGLPEPSTKTGPGTLGPLLVESPLALRTGDAVGAVRLQVRTDRPTRLEVTWDGQRRRWPAAEAHDVPVVGLGVDRRVNLEIGLTSDDGAWRTTRWPLEIEPLGVELPDIDVLALDPARTEPGHLLVHLKPPGDRGALVLLDASLDVVWGWRPDRSVGDVRSAGDGLHFVGGGNLFALDWTGEATPLLTREGHPPGGDLPDSVNLHHEAHPLDEGGWLTLDYQSVHVDRYPDVEGGEPAVVVSDRALQLAPDGTIVREARLDELLDLGRTNDNALTLTRAGYDWVHTNGIVDDPRDGGWIVSSRHQSALFEIDPAGEVAWILADPAGWHPRFRDRLLEPAGDVVWPDAQHAPELDGDVLIVFDNRMLSGQTSRVVGYRVDEAARTVAQAFVLDRTATGPERSQALGDADVQPITGNVLATYGFLDGWGGETADELGIGKRAVAIVEWATDDPDAPVLDVRFSDRSRDGWKAYRSEKLRVPGDR